LVWVWPVAKTLVRDGLLDELVLLVHPVLAGAGTPSDMLISRASTPG
jgi:riboflavin biosynthesis pyrimidine reductase